MQQIKQAFMYHMGEAIKIIDNLLANPRLQSDVTMACVARASFIRALFWAEQTLAAVRDDEDYKTAWKNYDEASIEAQRALYMLEDFHKQD